MLVIAVTSLSGGQGKTTCALFLGHELTRQGYSTLLVDADPLHDLTTYVGVELQSTQASFLEVLKGEISAPEAIYSVPEVSNLYLLPAKTDLHGFCEHLSQRNSVASKLLKHRLSSVESLVQVCIIDAPPQVLSMNSLILAIADKLVIPVEAAVKGYRSLIQTLDLLEELKKSHAIQPEVLGVVPFRDRWIGAKQSQECRLAIAGMIEEVGEALLLPSIKESELYKRAINQSVALSAIGIAEQETPFRVLFQKIQNHLEFIE